MIIILPEDQNVKGAVQMVVRVSKSTALTLFDIFDAGISSHTYTRTL